MPPPESETVRPAAAAAVRARRIVESLTTARAAGLAIASDGDPEGDGGGWLRRAYWELLGIYRFAVEEYQGMEWPALVARASLRDAEGGVSEEVYFAVFADQDGDLTASPLKGLPELERRIGAPAADHLPTHDPFDDAPPALTAKGAGPVAGPRPRPRSSARGAAKRQRRRPAAR